MPVDDRPSDVRATAAALAHPQPMRRGSLGERLMKCGKAACACHTDPDARHGPYFSLTRGVAHTTRSRFVTRAQAAVARPQVARAAAFRAHLCLLYTSDAADDLLCVDLGGRRIIKKK